MDEVAAALTTSAVLVRADVGGDSRWLAINTVIVAVATSSDPGRDVIALAPTTTPPLVSYLRLEPIIQVARTTWSVQPAGNTI